jgi:hypothetical protein
MPKKQELPQAKLHQFQRNQFQQVNLQLQHQRNHQSHQRSQRSEPANLKICDLEVI